MPSSPFRLSRPWYRLKTAGCDPSKNEPLRVVRSLSVNPLPFSARSFSSQRALSSPASPAGKSTQLTSMCGGRRRSGSHGVAIGVVRQGPDEHAQRHLERLRGINLVAIRVDLGNDDVLWFRSNHVERKCAARDRLAVNRRGRGRDHKLAGSFRRQAETIRMTEAGLLGDLAVE